MAVITDLLINAKNGTQGFRYYPIAKNIPININYNLADVREPDKRKASFSKTITIFGTNEVNKLFENIFSVNVVTQNFNKNLKTPCKYIVDGIENFKGDLQLIKVNIKQDDSIEYECSILGEGGSLFVEIGDKLITGNPDSADDLDFSTYDHIYNRATQISTRSNHGTGLGVLYPFIDKGTNGGSDTSFSVEDFLPCFHKHEYIKKIIEKAGYTYTSSILDSAEFKKHITYPNLTEVVLTQSQLENKQFYVGLNADAPITSGVYQDVVYTDDSTNGFFDLGSQLDPANDFVTLNANGYYNVAAVNYVKITATHSDPTVAYFRTTSQLVTKIIKSGNGGTSYFNLAVNTDFPTTISVLPGTGAYPIGVPIFASGGVATGSQFFGAGDILLTKVYCDKGSIVQFYNSIGNSITPVGTFTWSVELVSGVAKTSFYALCTQKTILSGDTMTCNSALPQKIKQKDYLKGIIQGLNLFIDIDPNNPTNLIIESFEDFYSGAIVNFENRTDKAKDQSINPNILDGKKYLYAYKEDKDHYNELYKNEYNEVFGTHEVEVENDFIKSDKKNELIFSPTPNVANYGLGIAHPRIYKLDGFNKSKITPNIRWLFCGGVKQTQNQWTYKETGQADLLTYDYLYAGHTDDPFNPTIDLNFGLPKKVYYDYVNAYFTTNNLFNRYHKAYLNNLINRDAKFVTKYLWLSPKDIYNFSFRNRLFIDGAYYIVNKIENYNPLEETSTNVELIKLLDTEVFTPESFLISSMPTIGGGNEVYSAKLNSALNVGSGIQNKGTNCIAIGENIVIPSSCSNVTVIGNNVVVSEGVSNSSVINTNDYELTQSNYSITNSVVIDEYFVDGSRKTVDATPDEITFNTPTGLFDLQGVDCVVRAEIRILAVDTATGDCKEWKGAKIIKNIAGATSTNNIETVVSVYSDLSMVTCTANMYDDATPQSIEVGIVGIAATTIEWKCYVNFLRINLW